MRWVLALALLAPIAWALATRGPWSARARYRREVRRRLAALPPARRLVESDLAALPPPVRRYVTVCGGATEVRVRHFRARWRGRIRAAPDAPWMPFTAEQHDFVDEPARFFRMDARRGGLPVDVYHAYAGGRASMEAKVLSLVPVVRDARPELARAETVTMLNDLCILAAAALTHPSLAWEAVDDRSARVRYTVPAGSVSAELRFDEEGRLVDFVSDDRLQMEGTELVAKRWSTPLTDYRDFGGVRVASRGEGRWTGPEGEWTYIELELLDLEVDDGT